MSACVPSKCTLHRPLTLYEQSLLDLLTLIVCSSRHVPHFVIAKRCLLNPTVPYVVERILQQGEERNKDRVFLPTGFQSQQLITHSGLRLGDITQYSDLDVTIDGADE
jgi:hypothetical protein